MIDFWTICLGVLVVSALPALVIVAAAMSNRRMFSDRPERVGVDTADATDLDGASLPVDVGALDGGRAA